MAFNLIDEKWIPTNIGLASIKDIFIDKSINFIGGNPRETISFYKFLQAVAMAANLKNLENDKKFDGTFEKNVVDYLENNHDKFDLYGNRPFLQFKNFKDNAYDITTKDCCNKNNIWRNEWTKSIHNLIPEVASGNNLITNQFNERTNFKIDDAIKAQCLIIELGNCINFKDNFSKKTEIRFTKNKDYVKYASKDEDGNNRPGANSCLGLFNFNKNGVLHILPFLETNMCETLELSVISKNMLGEEMFDFKYIKEIGIPPWDIDDFTEDHEYRNTMFSRLIPMNRFCLFDQNSTDVLYTEGIRYEYDECFDQDSICDYNYADDNDKKQKIIYSIVKPTHENNLINCLRNNLIANNNYSFKAIKGLNRFNNKKIVLYFGGCELKENTGLVYFKSYESSTLSLLESENYSINFFDIFIPILKTFNEECNYVEKQVKKYNKNCADGKKDDKDDAIVTDFANLFNSIYIKFFDISYDLKDDKFKKFRNDYWKELKKIYENHCRNHNCSKNVEEFYKNYPKQKNL